MTGILTPGTLSPGAVAEPALAWLNTHFHTVFAAISAFFKAVLAAGEAALLLAPALVVIPVLALLAAWLAGRRHGLICLGGLGLCHGFGMWQETVSTILLVLVAVVFSILIGLPLGIAISRRRWLQVAARPCLDVAQTLPPWVYLVPAVVLFGLGAVPALLATIVYGIAPMIRLTILAMSQVPAERIELGQAIGARKSEILRKIELPSALPTLLVGVNQCILLSLAMVVLAGLVGAGGLGAEVTRGLTRMDFGLGVRAGLSIVALAIVMDRVFTGLIPASHRNVGQDG